MGSPLLVEHLQTDLSTASHKIYGLLRGCNGGYSLLSQNQNDSMVGPWSWCKVKYKTRFFRRPK
jgi:hypothetical protein